MRLLRKAYSFNKRDWVHVTWLFKNMMKQFIIGNIHESKEAWYWIKIHFTYKSEQIKN